MANKNIGLALGGGAVLGAAHIGVLKALEEYDYNIKYISGTSIGAFVAALYAFGLSVSEIEKLALKLRWMDISELSLSQFGLLSNENLGDIVIENVKGDNIRDSKIPLAIVATNITSGEKVLLTEGDIKSAVMASTCLPGVFIPVEIDGALLVDGGITENVPVSPLVEMGAENIIAVDLNSGNKNKRPENIIEVMVNSFDFLVLNSTKLQTKEAALILKPDLSNFDMVDTRQIQKLIEKGYLETMKSLESIEDGN
ncbi:MAG: patatin [Melioribacteraceae bacterium]|nr:MAG: patatin [Melioribacteraceae bacterium]